MTFLRVGTNKLVQYLNKLIISINNKFEKINVQNQKNKNNNTYNITVQVGRQVVITNCRS